MSKGSVWHPHGPVVSIQREKGRTVGLWIAEIKVDTLVGWSLKERVGDVARVEMEFYPSDIVIRGDQSQRFVEWQDAELGDYYDSVYDGQIVGGAIKDDPYES